MIKKLFGYSLYFFLKRLDFRLMHSAIGGVVEVLRVKALKLSGARIGNLSFVRSGCYITYPKNLTLGRNSKINNCASLYLFERLSIGDNVEIGPELLVYTGDHKITDNSLPLTKQGTYNKPVIVEDDVYIGSRVTLLKGAKVKSRVVVAAGAVVSGTLDSGYLYGGVPAKKIKKLEA